MQSLKQLLEQYRQQNILPMHMPGHKRNPELAPYLNHLSEQWDITEIQGFDNLHGAQGILKEAMERATKHWESDRSRFLVNGSTCGILAGIRALTKRGDQILVARNCHKSVFHAIELCGLQPVFLLPPLMKTGLFGSLQPEQVEEKLKEYSDIKLVVVTSPTYEGVISDIFSICNIAHQRNIPVLVDEAHGAHLGFHPYFSGGAVKAGADVVVQSLHKTLPSLTQTAILHTNGSQVNAKRLDHELSVFETSSPSYLLLASIDGCMGQLREEYFTPWEQALKLFYQATASLKNLCILQKTKEQFLRDPSKIVILSKNGIRLGEELRKRKIEPELIAPSFVLAMTGMGDTPKTLQALADALLEIDRLNLDEMKTDPLVPRLPQLVMLPEQALEQEFEFIPPNKAKGRISAEYIWAYPPGIPLLIPGEQIETVPDAPLHSTRGALPRTIAVLKDTKPLDIRGKL